MYPQSFFYYLNDSEHGSFNLVLWGGHPIAELLFPKAEPGPLFTLWGQTCNSQDCVQREAMLPELDMGDWLVFHVCF